MTVDKSELVNVFDYEAAAGEILPKPQCCINNITKSVNDLLLLSNN